MLLAYTSYTSGPVGRVLPGLRAGGWRQLVSASHPASVHLESYAIDNGAWAAYTREEPWDEAPFLKLVDEIGEGADWIAAPDIVTGGLASLELSVSWLDRLPGTVLIPVQDGMTPDDLRGVAGGRIGMFVGGSTEFKESTMFSWGELAEELDCYLHIGRVNTIRRINLCKDARADSFDGNSPLMFPSSVGRLTAATQQLHLWGKQ